MVRRELGPQAAVLHTREVRAGGLFRWLPGKRQIEVTASTGVNVPSRLANRPSQRTVHATSPQAAHASPPSPATSFSASQQGTAVGQSAPRHETRDELQSQLTQLQAMVEDLCRRTQGATAKGAVPERMFHLFTDLIEADLSEEVARELIERVRGEAPEEELADTLRAKARIARMIEAEIRVAGPIAVTPGTRRLVALVGPTGVGKTTTIAKLAANYRLRAKRKVGLITVDTYRIAAVEQLRTYADIIDLPMHVVSTPREMRRAVEQMSDLDLVLMDTAGRSPKDEVKIQELKAFLTEAQADEVHLVLSSVAGATSLQRTAERFAGVGTTALILTKLDEATGLGNLLPLLRTARLPLSYLTNGQNVPDDIEAAQSGVLARAMLGLED